MTPDPAVEVDPSALSSEALLKLGKKDLLKHFGELQAMYTLRERKYGKPFTQPTNHLDDNSHPTSKGQNYHPQQQIGNSNQHQQC